MIPLNREGEMIQKVARAIFFAQNWREMPKDGDPEAEAAWTDGDSADPCFLLRAEAIHLARAALTALREPTEEMVSAGIRHAKDSDEYEMSIADWFVSDQWRAMIDAALNREGKAV